MIKSKNTHHHVRERLAGEIQRGEERKTAKNREKADDLCRDWLTLMAIWIIWRLIINLPFFFLWKNWEWSSGWLYKTGCRTWEGRKRVEDESVLEVNRSFVCLSVRPLPEHTYFISVPFHSVQFLFCLFQKYSLYFF